MIKVAMGPPQEPAPPRSPARAAALRLRAWLPVVAAGLAAAFQVATLRWEYPSEAQGRWSIQQDEKLIIPDCRYFYLRGSGPEITDYAIYPPSATFGVAGPLVSSLGFRLFGMNNFGLRVPFVLCSAITTALVLSLLLRLAPGPVGALFSVVTLCSTYNFALGRSAILENVLSLFLVSLLWLFACRRGLLFRRLGAVSFLAGCSTLVKINFPIYVHMLLFLMVLLGDRSWRNLFRWAAWGAAGLLFFEGAQFLLLHGLGIARLRYENLVTALAVHRHAAAAVHGVTIGSLPVPRHIVRAFALSFADWFAFPATLGGDTERTGSVAGAAMLLALGYGVFFGIQKPRARPPLAMAAFCALFLGISSFFFYYVKRGVPLFPIVVVLCAYVLHQALQWALEGFRPRTAAVLSWCLSAALAGPYAILQARGFAAMRSLRSDLVERNSAQLDRELPKGTKLYAHCYGLRFFWQAKGPRFISSDDGAVSATRMLEWAIRDRARYVLLPEKLGSDFRPVDSYQGVRLKPLAKYPNHFGQEGAFYWLMELLYPPA